MSLPAGVFRLNLFTTIIALFIVLADNVQTLTATTSVGRQNRELLRIIYGPLWGIGQDLGWIDGVVLIKVLSLMAAGAWIGPWLRVEAPPASSDLSDSTTTKRSFSVYFYSWFQFSLFFYSWFQFFCCFSLLWISCYFLLVAAVMIATPLPPFGVPLSACCVIIAALGFYTAFKRLKKREVFGLML